MELLAAAAQSQQSTHAAIMSESRATGATQVHPVVLTAAADINFMATQAKALASPGVNAVSHDTAEAHAFGAQGSTNAPEPQSFTFEPASSDAEAGAPPKAPVQAHGSTKDQAESEAAAAAAAAAAPEDHAQSGTLSVIVHSASELIKTEMFGKSDPYVRINVGSMQQQTRTHENGGSNPEWEQTLTFKCDEALVSQLLKESAPEYLRVSVWDDDMGGDDHMGDGAIPLRDLILEAQHGDGTSTSSRTYTLGGVKSGKLRMSLAWQVSQ